MQPINWIFIGGIAIIVLAIILRIYFSVVWPRKYELQFENIKAGMSYDEVINLLKEDPDFEHEAENIKTCTWQYEHGFRISPLFQNSFTVTFKDNIVISVSET